MNHFGKNQGGQSSIHDVQKHLIIQFNVLPFIKRYRYIAIARSYDHYTYLIVSFKCDLPQVFYRFIFCRYQTNAGGYANSWNKPPANFHVIIISNNQSLSSNFKIVNFLPQLLKVQQRIYSTALQVLMCSVSTPIVDCVLIFEI